MGQACCGGGGKGEPAFSELGAAGAAETPPAPAPPRARHAPLRRSAPSLSHLPPSAELTVPAGPTGVVLRGEGAEAAATVCGFERLPSGERGAVERSGLVAPGSRLVAVDGRDVSALALPAVVQLLRSQSGRERALGFKNREHELPALPSGPPLLPALPAGAPARPVAVLDLDWTLWARSFSEPAGGSDFALEVEGKKGRRQTMHVRLRPGARQLLADLAAAGFEIVTFTTSFAKVTDEALDRLDPEGAISARLYYDACSHHEGKIVKDLSRLQRPLERVVLLDDAAESAFFQPDSAIVCSAWGSSPEADEEDDELFRVARLLVGLADSADMREGLQRWESGSGGGESGD